MLDICVVVFFVAFLFALIGCKSSKVISERDVRDSVVYTYKTLYRDSLRMKDSTVLVYETVQRDSVVLMVDKNTGEVLSKDTWHWKDTNRDRDHIADVRKMVTRRDSLAYAEVRSDVRTSIRQKDFRPSKAEKTHYWRTWWIGVVTGIALSFAWKYRKKVFLFVSKCVRRGV